jgi:hypothetical protein
MPRPSHVLTVSPDPVDRVAVRVAPRAPREPRIAPSRTNVPRPVPDAGVHARDVAVSLKLKHHKFVLSSMGVDDIRMMPTLQLGGVIVPRPGLLAPLAEVVGPDRSPFAAPTVVRGVLRTAPRPLIGAARDVRVPDASSVALERVGGTAHFLKARPFPIRPPRAPTGVAGPLLLATAPVFPVDVAYWAASEIVIEDDTMVVLEYPNRWLVIITPKLTIGNNVTFTWEQPAHAPLDVPDPPGDRRAAGRSGLHGDDGATGRPGATGQSGAFGAAAHGVAGEGEEVAADLVGHDGVERRWRGGVGWRRARGRAGAGACAGGEECGGECSYQLKPSATRHDDLQSSCLT